jgi:hypothetical protein
MTMTFRSLDFRSIIFVKSDVWIQALGEPLILQTSPATPGHTRKMPYQKIRFLHFFYFAEQIFQQWKLEIRSGGSKEYFFEFDTSTVMAEALSASAQWAVPPVGCG